MFVNYSTHLYLRGLSFPLDPASYVNSYISVHLIKVTG